MIEKYGGSATKGMNGKQLYRAEMLALVVLGVLEKNERKKLNKFVAPPN